nr:MAG TPA: hypothetical protein [Caudoviricetes sp.]
MVPSPYYRHRLNNRLIYPAEREGMLLAMIQIYQFYIHPVENDFHRRAEKPIITDTLELSIRSKS